MKGCQQGPLRRIGHPVTVPWDLRTRDIGRTGDSPSWAPTAISKPDRIRAHVPRPPAFLRGRQVTSQLVTPAAAGTRASGHRGPEATRPRTLKTLSPYAVVLITYVATRLLNAAFIVMSAPRQLTGSQLPPGYHSVVPAGSPAGYSDIVTNWDGQWYWDIVQHGYPGSALDAAGEPTQTSLAFYPLYPTLCRILTQATGLGFEVVAPTLSLLLGAAAFMVLYRLMADVAGRTRALLGVAALSCFVSAPILQAAYTESLALALVALTLLLIRRQHYAWAVLPILLLGLTRNITLALVPVVALHWYCRARAARIGQAPRPRHAAIVMVLVACVAATAEWPMLAALITGEPGAYATTLKAWPGFTSSPLHPPLLDLVRDAGPAGWAVAGLLVALLAALLARPGVRAWGPELWGWAACYPLYIVGVASISLSFLRYFLLAFPFVLAVVPPAATPRQRQVRLVSVTAVCLLGLVTQWWWIANVLVIAPHGHGYAFP